MVQPEQPSDLLHLIDRLEELVAEARRMPIGGGVVVDRRRLLDLIDQLRVAIPGSVREARDVLDQRERILVAAQEQAHLLIENARAEAGRQVESHAIARQAEEHAREIEEQSRRTGEDMLADAERRVRERLEEVRSTAQAQMAEADHYALELLQRLEVQLNAFSGSVRDAIDTISRSPTPTDTGPAVRDLSPDDESYS